MNHTNLKDFDFIFITQTRWDDVSSTSLSLAHEIAKSHRVFLIDKPFTYKDAFVKLNTKELNFRLDSYIKGINRYRKLENFPTNFTLVIPNLALPINWLPKGMIYNFFLNQNHKMLLNFIQEICTKYKINKYILFNSFNPYYSFCFHNIIKPELAIYQSVDNIGSSTYLSKHGEYLELKISKEADLLLTTSKEINNKFISLGFPALYLPNAANIELFKEYYFLNSTRPKELESILKPIIGYIGTVDERFDFELLEKLSIENPDKEIVLIGPQKRESKNFNFKNFRNITTINSKPLNQLPLYLKYFNCGIIPFKKTDFTKSIYPLKINEYLAGGKPVVTTSFSTEITDNFSKVAYVASTHQEFTDLVNLAIKENSTEKEIERIQFAEKNSWRNRVQELFEIINLKLLDK